MSHDVSCKAMSQGPCLSAPPTMEHRFVLPTNYVPWQRGEAKGNRCSESPPFEMLKT